MESDEVGDEEGADSFREFPPEVKLKIGVLLGSILLVALCSIIYELIIGTLSSYLLGNSVYQFSLTIGLYLSGMGIGSYLSKYVRKNLLEKFFWVEVLIGLVGGTSASLLFGIFALTNYFQIVIWILTLGIGALVGLEIPLLTRYVRKYSRLSTAIANVLSWDYVGALVGSIAFPLLLLPALGLLNTGAVTGLVNILVACIGVWVFRHEIRHAAVVGSGAVLVGILLGVLFFTSGAYERFLDKKLFVDPVIYREQTPYQKLTLTAWKDDVRLYINGNIQFSSIDEYRYHEMLVHPAMEAAERNRDVLILGGGDGLVVRELEQYSEIERITMVDLDPRMTELAMDHPTLVRLNEHAMEDERLEIVNQDAMKFLEEDTRRWDVVLIDLPDPNNESLAKLYTVAFYRMVRDRLRPGGVMVTQSSSVYYSPNAYWSIHRTIEDVFCPKGGCEPDRPHVVGFHVWVPSFGDWGFNMAATRPLDPGEWDFSDVETRYLTEETMAVALHFPPDLSERDVGVNRLIEPVLLHYYLRDWKKFNP